MQTSFSYSTDENIFSEYVVLIIFVLDTIWTYILKLFLTKLFYFQNVSLRLNLNRIQSKFIIIIHSNIAFLCIITKHIIFTSFTHIKNLSFFRWAKIILIRFISLNLFDTTTLNRIQIFLKWKIYVHLPTTKMECSVI